MPLRWKLFRVVCIIQMLAASFFCITSFITLFEGVSFGSVIRLLLFLLVLLLTILAVGVINNNYPDTPVTGKQKTNFNRLFLLNFIFLIFLFGIIFGDYRSLKSFAEITNRNFFELPFELFISLIITIVVLLFQLVILYGLYVLRRELYFNFRNKQFEFEKDQLSR